MRETQVQGLIPDGSSRFSIGGQPIYHYMGTSAFANFTFVPEIALAKFVLTRPSTSFATLAMALPRALAR